MKGVVRTAFVATAAVAALVMSGCGARGGGTTTDAGADGGETFTLKFSHVVAATTPKGQAAEKFKELVESKSDGRITVQVFANSELYGDKDEFQALQSNSVQMLAPSSAKFTTVAPKLQVLDLPFLFDTPEDIPTVAAPDTAVGKAIFANEKLAEKDMKVLGLWDSGMKHLSSNDVMKTPADLKGKRFRIQPSDVLKSMIEAWGGQPTPMAFAEVYNALQQGLIDGQENTYSNMESQKMNTVQKHITESAHGYLGYILVINSTFYDSLPDDLKTAIDESAAEASEYNREVATDINLESKKVIEEAGTTEIYVPTDAERQAFKDAVVPSVWNAYKDLIGPEIIDELLAAQN